MDDKRENELLRRGRLDFSTEGGKVKGVRVGMRQ
jgi:hypothetical protein